MRHCPLRGNFFKSLLDRNATATDFYRKVVTLNTEEMFTSYRSIALHPASFHFIPGNQVMARRYNHNQAEFVKIVYSQVLQNGKLELIPLELYADGSLKQSQ